MKTVDPLAAAYIKVSELYNENQELKSEVERLEEKIERLYTKVDSELIQGILRSEKE
jgi:peptidoglycan hydrolase CwlO-like protein